jgi:hypothetical protein
VTTTPVSEIEAKYGPVKLVLIDIPVPIVLFVAGL